MPSLAAHHSNSLTKLLLIGDAKTGKTGSLASLVAAGYHLRILDLDNLLDILKYVAVKDSLDLNLVEYRTLRDKRKAGADGWVIDGQPRAFQDAVKMLDSWKYTTDDGEVIDLGRPAQWGPDCILVIDSLSRLCDAAYDWRLALAGPKMDGRAVYGDAQDAVEAVLAGLTSPSFQTNVIVIAHIQYMTLDDGKTKFFPQGVGQKLSPKIPQYFPSVVLYTNKDDKRTMQTNSTRMIDLANPRPFAMQPSYPIETGLASFFGVLQPHPDKENPRVVTSLEPKKPAPTSLIRR